MKSTPQSSVQAYSPPGLPVAGRAADAGLPAADAGLGPHAGLAADARRGPRLLACPVHSGVYVSSYHDKLRFF